MVASTKGTNKLCERRSTTWSGFCGVSKHCDQQCREWEKAAHGACHRQGLGMACFSYVVLGSKWLCGSDWFDMLGCGYGDETVQVQDGCGDGGDGDVVVMVMSYDGEVMRRFSCVLTPSQLVGSFSSTPSQTDIPETGKNQCTSLLRDLLSHLGYTVGGDDIFNIVSLRRHSSLEVHTLSLDPGMHFSPSGKTWHMASSSLREVSGLELIVPHERKLRSLNLSVRFESVVEGDGDGIIIVTKGLDLSPLPFALACVLVAFFIGESLLQVFFVNLGVTNGAEGLTNGVDGLIDGATGLTDGIYGITDGAEGLTNVCNGLTDVCDWLTVGLTLAYACDGLTVGLILAYACDCGPL
ncbi:defensin-like protein 1 [Tanacetum coccineum]